jgi:hypothetical protein
MEKPNQTNHAHQERSAGPLSTLERTRTEQAPFGDPTKPEMGYIHRVRNARMEKQMSESPWCGANYNGGNNATILDGDVTCPACQQIIASLSKERGTPPLTHFAGPDDAPFCYRGAEGNIVRTLRETTCSDCQDAAEAMLVGLITGGKDEILSATKPVMDLINKTIETRRQADQTQEQIASSLADIAETLKRCTACEKPWSYVSDFNKQIDANRQAALNQAESE